MQILSQLEVEVEFVSLPQSEIEDQGSQLRVLILRGALRYVAQTFDALDEDAGNSGSTQFVAAVDHENQ